MGTFLSAVLVGVILVNFLILGSSRMRGVIQAAGLQGLLLGLALIFANPHFERSLIVVAILTMSIKGVIMPVLLLRAMREVSIRREVEPLIGYIASLLLGAAGTGLALIWAHGLAVGLSTAENLVLAASFSTILSGFIVLVTRRKAITQVVGYLVLENGIFIFGLLLIGAMPTFVELGVLLDLLVGIFTMGIIINHIQRAFDSLDTTRLSALRE